MHDFYNIHSLDFIRNGKADLMLRLQSQEKHLARSRFFFLKSTEPILCYVCSFIIIISSSI